MFNVFYDCIIYQMKGDSTMSHKKGEGLKLSIGFIEEGKKINIPKKINQRKEGKKSVTFSITETELDIFEKEARERGFKNKSEFLAFIINNI